MKTKKQETIDELIELINIPQFERIIFHKIEELKFLLKDEIALYKSLRETFQVRTHGNMKVCEDDGKERTQTYRFELNLDEDGEWVPTGISPSPPPSCHVFDIVPKEVIHYISKFKPDPGKIEKIKEFSSAKLEGKIFELTFTRYSHRHALGTICELKEKIPIQPCDDPDNIIDINDSYKKEPEGGNYKELVFYMEKFPKFKAHIFSEFFLKWKPLIDNQMIEAN